MPDFFMMDAAQQFSFARQQSHVLNAQVYEIQYEDVDYASLITVDTSLPEWASGIDTLIGDGTGKAEWQSGGAKDIPLADVNLDMVSTTFDMFALGYQWNLEELGKAQFSNYPLTTNRAKRARRGADEFLYNLTLVGSTVKGWTGLINSSHVTPIALPADGTGSVRYWVGNDGVGTKTPAQIVRDINLVLLGQPGPGRVIKDTLLLPDAALDYIVATPYGATSPNLSIMQYVMANNEYTRRTGQPLTIKSLDQLKDAATSTTSPSSAGMGRMVGYRNTPDYMKLWVPMPFQFLPVYQDGPLNFVVPGICRSGGVDMLQPNGMAYGDGVTPVPA